MPTLINTLIALPYEIARQPVVLADKKLSNKLPESLSTRVDWALGSADRVAGAVLRNRDIAQRGTERVQRATTLLTAARLEDKADARREQAERVADAGQ